MTSSTHLLRAILLEGNARTQLEIQQEMKNRGVPSSQPNISRLLHQIGAVKVIDNHGKTQYRLPHEAGLLHEITSPQEKALIRQWVLDVVANESLIITYTTPGAAGMVARIIDQHRSDLDVLGTIAGDDTIFIAPKHIKNINDIVRRITELFNF